ncbi:hypothetical protein NDU88_001715 [Pleurodeles waltl]|uniref:Uncharacterized protein n=1 Tax=Pleurodeles waltl TaxID=8319 RepID=A0AAV7Q7V2_PLEWA|nr:hypothetical protein NDU88_001715 [Pleurodeles waltl]
MISTRSATNSCTEKTKCGVARSKSLPQTGTPPQPLGPHLTSQPNEARGTNRAIKRPVGQSKQHQPPPTSTTDASSTVQCNSSFSCKPRPEFASGPAQQCRATPSKLQALTKPMLVPPHPLLWQATSSFSPVSRLRSNAQAHSAGSATRQQAPAGTPSCSGKPPAPRSSRCSPAPVLPSPPSTRGAQTTGTSTWPKTSGAPGGGPGPLRETAHRGHPGPPGATSLSPALKAPQGLRSDLTAEGPNHRGERDSPARPPVSGSKEQPGALHGRANQRQ